jgi:hypothetical protein
MSLHLPHPCAQIISFCRPSNSWIVWNGLQLPSINVVQQRNDHCKTYARAEKKLQLMVTDEVLLLLSYPVKTYNCYMVTKAE